MGGKEGVGREGGREGGDEAHTTSTVIEVELTCTICMTCWIGGSSLWANNIRIIAYCM